MNLPFINFSLVKTAIDYCLWKQRDVFRLAWWFLTGAKQVKPVRVTGEHAINRVRSGNTLDYPVFK